MLKEGAGGGEKSTMSLLTGTWRLVYSSAFASGSLGGFRPGPQAALVPITIGQVRTYICCSWLHSGHLLHSSQLFTA